MYLHLPDYKEERTHSLDFIGLVLFGSGIALLSYVLEIFGEHLLSFRGDHRAALAIAIALIHCLRVPRPGASISSPGFEAVPHSHLSRIGERRLLYPAGNRRRPVPPAASLSGWTRLQSGAIGTTDHAAGDRFDEYEDYYAAASDSLWLSRRADLEHLVHCLSADSVCHHQGPEPRFG